MMKQQRKLLNQFKHSFLRILSLSIRIFIIIAGHTRLKAQQNLGLKEVPVIVAEDLTTDQANALRLADNKTTELAKLDKKLLDEELRKIDWEALNIQMTDLGFNDIFASDFQEVIDDEFGVFLQPSNNLKFWIDLN